MVFQSPTLMPWARVDANVRLPLDLARVAARERRPRRRRGARSRRPRRIRPPVPARALGRHADACVDRARARHRAGPAADGRALRRARRVHAPAARRRAARAVGRARPHGRLRHPQHRRSGVPVDARRRDGGASGARSSTKSRSTRPIRAPTISALAPEFAAYCRRLSERVAAAGAAADDDAHDPARIGR